MEPVSTLVLAAAFLVTAPSTRLNIWEARARDAEKARISDVRTEYLLPSANLDEEPSSTQVLKIESPSVSPKELLKEEVSGYSRFGYDWNGEGTLPPGRQVVDLALNFIDTIPSRLPLPRPMLSSSGELGLYWDFAVGYAEASFDPLGTVTFFSRDEDGIERFEENLPLTHFTIDWFWAAIGPLDLMPVAA